MKSLTTNVFFPAWLWGPMNMPSTRFLAASYSQKLTRRDNIRFRQIITSEKYRAYWGDVFAPSEDTFTTVEVGNNKRGWKLATSIGGAVTGYRGDIVLLDDPNSVQEAESDAIREHTNDWFRETLPSRLNDAARSSIIVIQQRTHELDVSGTIIDLGLDYTHLVIPAEYDTSRHCVTVLRWDNDTGEEEIWQDPRGLDEFGQPLTGAALDAQEGALAWEARFPATELKKLKDALGPYAYAGQYLQSPNPRGGGIFKTAWWREWPPVEWPEERRWQFLKDYPKMSYVVASLDPSLTEKKQNDPSALTIWGIWKDNSGIAIDTLITDANGFGRIVGPEEPRIMLMWAWQKRLQLHGPPVEKPADLTMAEWNSPRYLPDRQKDWGLVEWVAHSCRMYNVDLLLIENKAGGEHVVTELHNMLSGWEWAIQLSDPGNFDKVARAHGVVHLFSNGLVYGPLQKDWCDEVIHQAARFPRGKNDDLVDSMTQALRHLRDTRWALRKEEVAQQFEEELRYFKNSRPLYDT